MRLIFFSTLAVLFFSSPGHLYAKSNVSDLTAALTKAYADCEASGGDVDQCKATAKIKIQNKAREILIKKIGPMVASQCKNLSVGTAQCNKALSVISNCASNSDPQVCQQTAFKMLALAKAENQITAACAKYGVKTSVCSAAIKSFEGCATNKNPQNCVTDEINSLGKYASSLTSAAKNQLQANVAEQCASNQIPADTCSKIQSTAQACSTTDSANCLSDAVDQIKSIGLAKAKENVSTSNVAQNLNSQCTEILTQENCNKIKDAAQACLDSGASNCLQKSQEQMGDAVKSALSAKLTEKLAAYGIDGTAISRIHDKYKTYQYFGATYTQPAGDGAWVQQAITTGDADKIMNNNTERCDDTSIEESVKTKLALAMGYMGSSDKEISAAQSRYASARKSFCDGVAVAATFQQQLNTLQKVKSDGIILFNKDPLFDKKLKMAGRTRTVKYRIKLTWYPDVSQAASGNFDPKSQLSYDGAIKWSTKDWKSPAATVRKAIEDLTGGFSTSEESKKKIRYIYSIPYVSEASGVIGGLGFEVLSSGKTLKINSGMKFKYFGNRTYDFSSFSVDFPGDAMQYVHEARDNAKQKAKDELVGLIGTMGIVSKEMQALLTTIAEVKMNGGMGSDDGNKTIDPSQDRSS